MNHHQKIRFKQNKCCKQAMKTIQVETVIEKLVIFIFVSPINFDLFSFSNLELENYSRFKSSIRNTSTPKGLIGMFRLFPTVFFPAFEFSQDNHRSKSTASVPKDQYNQSEPAGNQNSSLLNLVSSIESLQNANSNCESTLVLVAFHSFNEFHTI